MKCIQYTPYFIECTHSISLFVECVHSMISSTTILKFFCAKHCNEWTDMWRLGEVVLVVQNPYIKHPSY